jgi:hypothetical protein
LREVFTTGKVMVMTFADLVARNAALSGEVARSHEALKAAQLTRRTVPGRIRHIEWRR